MAKMTNHEQFQATWEEIIPTLSSEEIFKYFTETSPNHPNENMRGIVCYKAAVK